MIWQSLLAELPFKSISLICLKEDGFLKRSFYVYDLNQPGIVDNRRILRCIMSIKNSVTTKLVTTTGIGIFVVLFITAVFTVRFVSDTTSNQLRNNIENSLNFNASGIESYFSDHITRVDTVFRNTTLIDWFDQHKVRGESLDTQEFSRVKSVLQREVDEREDIISIFFGSGHTGEYIDHSGVSALVGYNVLERPWWNEVKDSNEWNVSRVIFEPKYDTFYISLNFPIENFDNKFIGAGGTDIYLTAVDNLVSKIKYQNQGQAFLIDNNGDMIVFPDEELAIVDIEKRETTNIKLADLDKQNQHQGFAELSSQMLSNETGDSRIVWKNKDYYVQYKNVEVPELQLKWSLAIMVPVSIVDEPVDKAITYSALIIFGILIVTLILLLVATSKLLKPLYQVKQALVEISSGAGDLSQRILVKSQDEIGQLSEAFNTFISQIHKIVSQVQVTSEELKSTTGQVANVSEVTVGKVSTSREEIHKATDTVGQMAETAHVIKEQIQSASDAAKVASETSKEGQAVLSNSMKGLTQLNNNFDSAVHTIEELRESSHSIGEVMDVIRNIADQTNLLALNAAIESARAGEHGRGFAVVADEVRQLAKRTQESTESIQKNITDLQEKAKAAEGSMQVTRGQVNKYMDDSHVVHRQLTEITQVVDDNQDKMKEIVSITLNQDNVTQSISHTMEELDVIGDQTSTEAQSLMEICGHLSDKTDRLSDLVERFKV